MLPFFSPKFSLFASPAYNSCITNANLAFYKTNYKAHLQRYIFLDYKKVTLQHLNLLDLFSYYEKLFKINILIKIKFFIKIKTIYLT